MKTSALTQVAIINLDFNIWCGETNLEDIDIKLGVGGSLPPKSVLASCGRKTLIDSKNLNPFRTLKTQARRACESIGMPFMNGFAIPIARINEISHEIDAIKVKMSDLKANFLANYDKWCEEWALNPDNLGYEHAIRKDKVPAHIVAKRLAFDYQIFQINPVNDDQAQKLDSMTSGLSEKLLAEVVSEAKEFFDKRLKGRDSLKLSTKQTLLGLRNKVDGLAFLDGQFIHIVELLDKALSGYSAAVSGDVTGEAFYKIMSAALILTNEDQIKQYADNLIDVDPSSVKTMRAMFPVQAATLPVPSPVVATNAPTQPSYDDDVESFFAQCVPAVQEIPAIQTGFF